MNLKKLCLKYDINVKGIIQVGASTGQELDEFLSLNPKKMILIEPLPQCVEELRNKTKKYSHILVVEKAITNFNGISTLNITNNLLSSSLLPLGFHRRVFQKVKKVAEIEVTCQKLDTLLWKLKEKTSDFNLLYVDVQGAELLVLKGATETLKHIEAIHIEANYKGMYKDCVLESELTKFLQCEGFEKMETSLLKFFQNDIFYVRMH